jgi:protein disulfide-isomerase
MRWFSLSLLVGLASLAVADDSEAREPTYFNGIKVPPMLELTPDNWEKESKYIIVKHFR